MVTTPQQVLDLLHDYCVVTVGRVQVNNDLTISARTADIRQQKPSAQLPFRFNSLVSFDSYNQGLIDLSCLPEQQFYQAALTYYHNLAMLRLVFAQQVLLYPATASNNTGSQPEIRKVREIVHKYQGRGQAVVIAFATELAQAGLKENARW